MKVIKIASKSNSADLLLLSKKNSKGEAPLYLAAHHGQLEVVRYILKQWPTPVDTPGSNENPSTTVTIDMGDINQLLNVDLPWRMKSNNGDTPAHKAVRNKHASVALHLLRVDPELTSLCNKENKSLLYLSANNGCYAVLRHILSEDRDYSTSGGGAQNVLHAAARTRGISACKNLMTKQPHLLKMVDNIGRTPLHYAAEYDMPREIKLLLKQDKLAAFTYDNEGFTPVLRAADLGYFSRVRSILDLCLHSAELRDLNSNKTILHLAKLSESPLNLFMNRKVLGRLINEIDNDGNTALHCAILDRDAAKALSLLKTKGINWRVQNKKNQSPQSLCRELLRSGETEQLPVAIVLSNLELGECPISIAQRLMFYLTKNSIMTDYKMAMSEEYTMKFIDNIAVVAGLLLGISSTGAFTIPGGYDQNTGDTMRMKEVAILVFMSSNVLAMLLCVSILFRYSFGVCNGKSRSLVTHCTFLLRIAIIASVVAFLSGSYAIGSHFKSIITLPIIIAIIINFCTHFLR